MNKLFFMLSILVSTTTINAQDHNDEYLAISNTLDYYLTGGTNNDFLMLAKAFHSSATMKFVNNDGYKEVNALEFFKAGMKPGPKQQRTTKIVFIDVSGNSASAKLRISYDGFSFHDYMQLLKIDGEWKITSKIFYKEIK